MIEILDIKEEPVTEEEAKAAVETLKRYCEENDGGSCILYGICKLIMALEAVEEVTP